MNILASLFFLVMSVYVWPENFFDTPLAQWTLKSIFKSILSFGSIYFCINFLKNSLEKDRIWPWNWTLPYFKNLCIKISAIILVIVFSHYMIEHTNFNSIIMLILGAGNILFIMFSPDFNIFEEKENIQHGNK